MSLLLDGTTGITFPAGGLILTGSTSGTCTVNASAISGTAVLTMPTGTDTLVGKATTDTLTNKSIAVTQLTGTLPVANGGTGVTTSTGTGATVRGTSPSISGAVMTTMASSVITSGTAVASTSGTSIDFTSIPSWVKRITVMFNGVSTNGSSLIQVQIGDSGGIETTSYSSGAWTANTTSSNATTGFIIHGANFGVRVWDGAYTIVLMDTSNTWVFTGMCNSLNDNAQSIGIGRKQVSATLDRVRITTVNGTDTFDAGSINILYE